jgi:lauroyl/myristoyl acyltransferase
MSRDNTRTKRLDVPLVYLFRLLLGITGNLPLPAVRRGTRVIFLLLYPLVGLLFGLRRRVARNVAAAYGESLTAGQTRTIAKRIIFNQLLFFMELLFYYHRKNRDALTRSVSIEGMENLAAARRRSKGVIGVSAHLSNFQLMMLSLSLEDSQFAVLIKSLKSRVMSKEWIRHTDAFGLRTIMIQNRVSATKRVIRELRRSTFVMFVADEFARRGGHIVTFFGKKTSMAAGPARLSTKMGIPMLPCFIVREDTGRYRIIVEPAIEITGSGDYEADCLALTQKRIEILEKYIRQYTDQWLWTQNRWKRKILVQQ